MVENARKYKTMAKEKVLNKGLGMKKGSDPIN